MWVFFSLKKKNCSLNEILKKIVVIDKYKLPKCKDSLHFFVLLYWVYYFKCHKTNCFHVGRTFSLLSVFFLTKLFPKNNRNVTNQISYYLQLIFIICVHQIAITILKLVIIFIFLNRSKKLSVLFSLHALPCQAILTSDYFCSLLIKKLSESIN